MQFTLILECGRPIAAIIPPDVTPPRIKLIYSLLPATAFNQPHLAARWGCWMVACEHDWAAAQLRRVPMTIPKQTVSLAFL